MDQTKRPLLIPPEFANYAEKHGVFDMYKRLLQQLIINKPEDPVAFLVEILKRENDDVPQVIILGPPASGKRSIAKMVCAKTRAAHLTMQNLVAEAEIDIKEQAESFIRNNQAVPPELWLRIINDRMQLFDCVKKGWVLEGFPQTREQAQILQQIGIYPKHCIVLDAPDTVFIERASGKRIDRLTGDVYHTTFDWPTSSAVQGRLEEVPGNTEEEVVTKLVMYHRYIDGIKRSFGQVVKIVNADQPKADVFSQAFSFLCSQPRTNSPHTPRIILLGPTGSGKSVQASLLAAKYNIVNVSMDQLLKQSIVDEKKAGMAAKNYLDKNSPVPDNIVLTILKERLGQLDCVTRGWVIHGYPRTREQGEQLLKSGFMPNRVFFLDVPNDSVLERLTLRATDPVTGDRFHMMYNPPLTHEVKERLQRHPQDSEDEVRKRLAQYHIEVEELGDLYEDGQRINADQDPHTVFECLESMIVNPIPNRF